MVNNDDNGNNDNNHNSNDNNDDNHMIITINYGLSQGSELPPTDGRFRPA